MDVDLQWPQNDPCISCVSLVWWDSQRVIMTQETMNSRRKHLQSALSLMIKDFVSQEGCAGVRPNIGNSANQSSDPVNTLWTAEHTAPNHKTKTKRSLSIHNSLQMENENLNFVFGKKMERKKNKHCHMTKCCAMFYAQSPNGFVRKQEI